MDWYLGKEREYEASGCSETSVTIYRTIFRHIPENCSPKLSRYRHGNFEYDEELNTYVTPQEFWKFSPITVVRPYTDWDTPVLFILYFKFIAINVINFIT
jgi:hypothetical protein